MKVLVTGAGGQLGADVLPELIRRGHEGIGLDLAEMDITKRESVLSVIGQLKPDAVIHCAAWTAVDSAEEPENREKVFLVNAEGTRNVSEACKRTGAKLLYLSTDYVFDGEGTKPWEPHEKAHPLNVYGESKLLGEEAVATLKKHFIVRISWVFGKNGKNFVRTMLNLAKTHESLKVVNNQFGTPTYTVDLARLIVDMIETEKYGIYHASNEGGYLSWYDFAKEIFLAAGCTTQVVPVTAEEYGLAKAKRPHNSRLNKQKLLDCGFTPLPPWQNALRRYLKEIGECDGSD